MIALTFRSAHDGLVHEEDVGMRWEIHPTHGATLCGVMFYIGKNTLRDTFEARKTSEVPTCLECAINTTMYSWKTA